MSFDSLITLGNIAIILTMGWLTPGPNMLAVISASVSNGRQSGLAVGAGLALGGVFWTVLAVTGVISLFELYPDLVFTLRVIGAGYLIWLGIKSLKSGAMAQGPTASVYRSDLRGWKAFKTGLLVTATNPKAALFFSSILTAFVPVDAPMWLLVAIVVLSGTQGMLGHTITATVFSTNLVVAKFQAANRAISMVFGAVFCSLGIGVAYDAIKRL